MRSRSFLLVSFLVLIVALAVYFWATGTTDDPVRGLQRMQEVAKKDEGTDWLEFGSFAVSVVSAISTVVSLALQFFRK